MISTRELERRTIYAVAEHAPQISNYFDHHHIIEVFGQFGDVPFARGLIIRDIFKKPFPNGEAVADAMLNVYTLKHDSITEVGGMEHAVRDAFNEHLERLGSFYQRHISDNESWSDALSAFKRAVSRATIDDDDLSGAYNFALEATMHAVGGLAGDAARCRRAGIVAYYVAYQAVSHSPVLRGRKNANDPMIDIYWYGFNVEEVERDSRVNSILVKAGDAY